MSRSFQRSNTYIQANQKDCGRARCDRNLGMELTFDERFAIDLLTRLQAYICPLGLYLTASTYVDGAFRNSFSNGECSSRETQITSLNWPCPIRPRTS